MGITTGDTDPMPMVSARRFLWRVSVGLYLLWRVSIAGEGVAPKKVWATPTRQRSGNYPGSSPSSVEDYRPSNFEGREPERGFEPLTCALRMRCSAN